jgi:hypothetical protein
MTMLRTKCVVILAALAAMLCAGEAWAGRGSSLGQIKAAIRTNNADVIASELEAAEKLVCGQCVGEVLVLLDHSDYRIREVAAWWIVRRPVISEAVTAQSYARLAGDPVSARNAADALGTFRHPRALSQLDAALDRGFPDETTEAIVRAVGTIGHPEGEATVLKAMASPGPLTRAAATKAYWELRGTRSGDALTGLINDGSVEVRRAATAAIGSYQVAGARGALESLVASDPDVQVRRNAAFALGRIGDAASYATLKAAADGDASSIVRGYAQVALRNLH